MAPTIPLYVLYFFFYSAAGWLMESIYCSLAKRKWINRGFLTGPMCPIYGTGAVALLVCLSPIKDSYAIPSILKPVLLFIVGMIVADIVEFITSVLMEKLFHARWWDYSDRKFNIQGRICLRNSLYWGIATIVFFYIVHPPVEEIISMIPTNIVYIILGLIFAVFLADLINAVRTALDIRKLMDKMRSMKENIEQKMAEFQQSVSKRTEQSSWAGDFSARLTETKEQLDNYQKLKRPGLHKTGRMFRGSQLNKASDRSIQAIEEALAELKRKLTNNDDEMY